MAALLKDVYNLHYIGDLAAKIHACYPAFQQTGFINAIFDDTWGDKELKARTEHIAQQLHCFIPLEYKQALFIIKHVAQYFTSYQGLFIPAFVEQQGLHEFALSMDALAHITQFSSAEFAVRPFIQHYPEQMQIVLLNWARSENEHVRRLASEGCRPRLPWAMALPEFKHDPSYIIPILECLKNDDSEYVRRSVANNLNDIAKDHPQLVIKTVTNWLNKDKKIATQRLVKHACRSLLKQANPEALTLFGFLPPVDINVVNLLAHKSVVVGENIHFSFQLLQQESLALGKLRIEFAIDFMKKNGRQARKIFQLSEGMIKTSRKEFKRTFSFKKISTRQYYVGKHTLAILVNGVQLSETHFTLTN